MMSVRTTIPDRVDVHGLAARDCSARLSLKPSSSTRSALDGAWWPGSAGPVIELAALIETVADQRVPVRRLSLTMAGWDSAPRRIRLASGRRVAVDWFRAGNARIIRIVGTDDQRLDLLVIPVNTAQATAHQALAMATDGQDPDITATVGDHSAPVCSPAEPRPPRTTKTAP
jgi:Family of unknown function (DUF5994)